MKDIEEMEKCVVCGKITNIPKNMPIDERKTYVETSGQLCKECCMEIYGTDDLRTISSE